MRELKDAEERILDRALYLIGKTGSTRISIRAIAKEAGVNVGAVNYYFGSKEEMLRRVDEFYLKNTRDTYSALDREEYSDEEKILHWADAVMEYSLRYPGITVLLKEKRNRTDALSRNIIETTREMNERMFTILLRVIGGDDSAFAMNRTIFLSSILQPLSEIHRTLFPDEGFGDRKYRMKYIAHIIGTLKRKP